MLSYAVIHQWRWLDQDSRFGARVIRLAATSVVALGLIWGFQFATLQTPAFVGICLAVGWALMPVLLILSLRWPMARYGRAGPPSTLVGVGLSAIPCWPGHDQRMLG